MLLNPVQIAGDQPSRRIPISCRKLSGVCRAESIYRASLRHGDRPQPASLRTTAASLTSDGCAGRNTNCIAAAKLAIALPKAANLHLPKHVAGIRVVLPNGNSQTLRATTSGKHLPSRAKDGQYINGLRN